MRQIVLLTDFGLKDNYVGIMKAVIANITKNHNIIDLTHNIEPQNILQGAFILSKSIIYFDDNNIFCCVVSPNLNKEIILIHHKNNYYLAPNNGLLSCLIDESSDIYLLDDSYLEYLKNSNNFNSFTLFSTISAELCMGNIKRVKGRKIPSSSLIKIDLNEVENSSKIIGKIMNIDTFGNLITNISNNHFENIDSILINKFSTSYKSFDYFQIEKDKIFIYKGDNNSIELASKNSSANNIINCKIGDEVIANKKRVT